MTNELHVPPQLRALHSSDASIRKSGARFLVGKLHRDNLDLAMQLLLSETEPEVFKWLAMAVAKVGAPRVEAVLLKKLDVCRDANARDWLVAAQAILTPLSAPAVAESMIRSRDESVVLDGAITAWAARRISDELNRSLLDVAGDGTCPDSRRWAALALNRQGADIPPSVLLANLRSSDYLLREWTLHVLVDQPSTITAPAVIEIAETAPHENPRVVEWAVHALPTATTDESELDDLLVEVYRECSDNGVRDACATELARRLSPRASEFLVEILRSRPGPVATFAVITSIAERLESADASLRSAIELNSSDLQAASGLAQMAAYTLTSESMSQRERTQLSLVLANPVSRMVIELTNGHLEELPLIETENIRVGVLIALDEEFESYAEALDGLGMPEMGSTGAHYVRTFDRAEVGGRKFTLISRLIGRAGAEHAAVAAAQLVEQYRPEIVVSIGISGALSDELSPGDIVIGDTSTAYLANSRIEDSGLEGFAFKPASEPFRADKWLSDRAAGLRFEAPSRFREWQDFVRATIGESLAVEVLPQVRHGHIAAGPSVVSSERFKVWLLRQRRDYLAVDMESSGVATAAWADSTDRARLLIIRGISDSADSSKRSFEKMSDGFYRRLAMVAAARYLIATLGQASDSWSA